MHQTELSGKQKQQVCEVFEGLAEHYATERERTAYFRAQVEIAVSMLAGESGRILDIGCAAGGDIPEYRSRQFSVIGIDLSPRMLEFARRRFADDGQVHFCQADVERLPFADQSMDHVVCLGVFEFLSDYESPLREIRRVLRPGGLAVFAIPSRISIVHLSESLANITLRPLWRGAKRLVGRKSASTQTGGSLRRNLCVPWRYRHLLQQNGLSPERQRYTNLFIYPLYLFPKLDERVCAFLESLCSVPVVRYASSVYMVSARKE